VRGAAAPHSSGLHVCWAGGGGGGWQDGGRQAQQESEAACLLSQWGKGTVGVPAWRRAGRAHRQDATHGLHGAGGQLGGNVHPVALVLGGERRAQMLRVSQAIKAWPALHGTTGQAGQPSTRGVPLKAHLRRLRKVHDAVKLQGEARTMMKRAAHGHPGSNTAAERSPPASPCTPHPHPPTRPTPSPTSMALLMKAPRPALSNSHLTLQQGPEAGRGCAGCGAELLTQPGSVGRLEGQALRSAALPALSSPVVADQVGVQVALELVVAVADLQRKPGWKPG
jgi:hypothetical protein